MSIESLYQDLLGRGVDPSGAGTYAGWSDDQIRNAIMGSQEYANRQGSSQPSAPQQSSGGGDINSIYQQYLGRGVDPSGAATYAGWNPQDIINAITGSQEYAQRRGGGSGQAAPAQQTQQTQQQAYTPGQSYGEYNFEMTGPPSSVELATNPSMANAWYAYSGTSPAPAMTWQTAPDQVTYNPVAISRYQDYGLEKPFNPADIQAPVDPSSIRYGYGNTPYAAVKSNIAGLPNGGEYVVNPQTGKFILDASGNPIPVPQQPYSQGTFDTIMTDYLIPGFIAAAAVPVLGGLGGQAFGALGSGAELGAAGELMGPTYGELGYTGLEAGQFGPTYGELGYTGLNNASAIAAADAAAAAALANAGMSTSTLASLLKGGASILGIANKVLGSNQTPTKTSPTGTNPYSTLLRTNTGTGTGTGTNVINPTALPGLLRGNVNPYSFAQQAPIMAAQTNKADPFAALKVEQLDPTKQYNPLAMLKEEGIYG